MEEKKVEQEKVHSAYLNNFIMADDVQARKAEKITMETEKCQDDLKSLEVKIDSVKRKTKKIFEEKCSAKKI